MRAWLCLVVLLVGAGCRVAVPVHPLTEVTVDAEIAAKAELEAEAELEVKGELEAEAELEAETGIATPEPIATPAGPVKVGEFFGIALDDARDIVFVLDRSGSMNDPTGPMAHQDTPDAAPARMRRIEMARAQLIAALEGIPGGTRVNVIYFNHRIEGFAPALTPLDGTERDELIEFVRTMGATGATALAPAMRTALLMNPRRVVLLSDGLGNRGGTSRDVLRDAREAMRGGVRIDAIGLGDDQDAELLEALARESGGIYRAF
jgi:hypothetical protein